MSIMVAASEELTMPRGSRRPYSVWIERARLPDDRSSYRIRWIDPATGERRSEPCGTDRAFARDRRDAKVAELRAGLRGDGGDRRVRDLLDQLESWMAGRARETRANARRSLERLIALCGNARLRMVDRRLMMEYRGRLSETGLTPAAVNKHLRHVKAALTLAVDAGWLPANPAWHWKAMLMPEAERRIRVVEPAEYEKIANACADQRLHLAVILSWHQGIRRTDLVQLRWDALDLERGVAQLASVPEAGEYTKTRRRAAIPLRVVPLAALRAWWDAAEKRVTARGTEPRSPYVLHWPNGRPLGASWLSREFGRTVLAAGIPACTLHDLRRSFSTLAQRAGEDPSTVMQLGGWSSVAVVRRHYTGDVSEGMRRAADRLDQAEAAG